MLYKIKNQLWYLEEGSQLDNICALKIKKVIVPETDTGFQKIMILETAYSGRVLILDDIIQLEEGPEEQIYHEIIAHLPIFLLPKPPQKVLIIGGGDAGAAREILKHKTIKKVTLVEIDPMVINLCQKYLPKISKGAFKDKRLEIIIGEGAEFVKSRLEEEYDAVIIDSNDPVGPSKIIHQKNFYENIYRILKKPGIAIQQTELFTLQLAKLKYQTTFRKMKKIFDEAKIIQSPNINYLNSFTLGAKSKRALLKDFRKRTEVNFKKSGLKTNWFSPEISFELYPYFKRRIKK